MASVVHHKRSFGAVLASHCYLAARYFWSQIIVAERLPQIWEERRFELSKVQVVDR
jgi:hypothetical protein